MCFGMPAKAELLLIERLEMCLLASDVTLWVGFMGSQMGTVLVSSYRSAYRYHQPWPFRFGNIHLQANTITSKKKGKCALDVLFFIFI